MINADITIKVTVKAKKRVSTTWLLENVSNVENFSYVTSVASWETDLPNIVNNFFPIINILELAGEEPSMHYSVTIDNVTAAPPYKGSVTQAKAHIDKTIAAGNVGTVEEICDDMAKRIRHIVRVSKYDILEA